MESILRSKFTVEEVCCGAAGLVIVEVHKHDYKIPFFSPSILVEILFSILETSSLNSQVILGVQGLTI